MNHSKKLFAALCRRLHRLQEERKEAWRQGHGQLEDRLARRCLALTWAILDLELPDRT